MNREAAAWAVVIVGFTVYLACLTYAVFSPLFSS